MNTTSQDIKNAVPVSITDEHPHISGERRSVVIDAVARAQEAKEAKERDERLRIPDYTAKLMRTSFAYLVGGMAAMWFLVMVTLCWAVPRFSPREDQAAMQQQRYDLLKQMIDNVNNTSKGRPSAAAPNIDVTKLAAELKSELMDEIKAELTTELKDQLGQVEANKQGLNEVLSRATKAQESLNDLKKYMLLGKESLDDMKKSVLTVQADQKKSDEAIKSIIEESRLTNTTMKTQGDTVTKLVADVAKLNEKARQLIGDGEGILLPPPIDAKKSPAVPDTKKTP